jgi:hypothetical protein
MIDLSQIVHQYVLLRSGLHGPFTGCQGERMESDDEDAAQRTDRDSRCGIASWRVLVCCFSLPWPIEHAPLQGQ